MTNKQKNFTKALDWTNDLQRRYMFSLAAFRIYERFRKMKAPNIVGKRRAEANAQTYSHHTYFFTPLEEAARCYFFLELAKLFDKDPKRQSLTVEALLDFAENHSTSFSINEFLNYHSGRYFDPVVFSYYKPLTDAGLQRFRKRLRRNASTIGKLRDYRDTVLAHSDRKKRRVTITLRQIQTLFNFVRDLVDYFYASLAYSSHDYRAFDRDPVRAVDHVIEILQQQERQWLREIEGE